MSSISTSISKQAKQTCFSIAESCASAKISAGAKESWQRLPYYMYCDCLKPLNIKTVNVSMN